MINPVILCGGKGTRLWPLSRSSYPKQYLALLGEQTLLQATVARVRGAEFRQPTIICNQEHRFLAAEQLREIQVKPDKIILENQGKNTAPAIAVACLLQPDPEQLMLVLPADHIIKNLDNFQQAIQQAIVKAQQGKIVTFGVKPTAADPNYGYIEHQAGRINKFVEKPSVVQAKEFINAGNYLWNSGMFLFKAKVMLEELERYKPGLLAACQEIVQKAQPDLDFWRLDFDLIPEQDSESIDYAIMEKTNLAAVVPAELDWSDVGSWGSLYQVSPKNAEGNVLLGDVITHNIKNSYIKTEDRLIAAIGLENIIITATKDAILVSSKDHVAQIKQVVKKLQDTARVELEHHTTIYRPWGTYQVIDQGPGFKVKRLVVKPGQKTSMQFHQHRSEHWVVVAGVATITKDEDTLVLYPNQSVYISIGEQHRIDNLTNEELHLIEVQAGDYLAEDDIVRVDDAYGRIKQTC